jgi:hypothetical protein
MAHGTRLDAISRVMLADIPGEMSDRMSAVITSKVAMMPNFAG